MTFKELADLIFPDARDISYYEEKYPERDLPEGAIVTRFAPSPTGSVHIGALEQCIVETALIKNKGGVLMLRIEDTDQKRKVENGVKGIIDSLKDFDITFDEGMTDEQTSKGAYGPYIQSQRREIYQAFAKYLISIERAYPCFATPEELEDLRKRQEAQGLDNIGYYGEWALYRELAPEEAAARIKKGEPYVIRFKSMGKPDGRITCKDMIKGQIEMPQNMLDIVIIKGDGLPTYHFAHAVDDHLMRTTHVIRSSEWAPSLPLHLELFKTLGFKVPKYCHYAPMLKLDVKRTEDGTPVLNEDGSEATFKRKISKRKDPEAAVDYYYKEGIPSESVKEYLMTIANSDFEAWREQNPAADLYDFPFSLKKMSTTEGALFDMDKLMDVSRNVISGFPAEKLVDDVSCWAARYDETLAGLLKDKSTAVKFFGIERGPEMKKKRKDIGKWSEVKDYISYLYDELFYAPGLSYDYPENFEKETIARLLPLYLEKYYAVQDDAGQWFERVKDLSEEIGYAREVKLWRKDKEAWPGHVGDVCMVLRVALTGRRNTPDLYQIMQVMGEKTVRERLAKAAAAIGR